MPIDAPDMTDKYNTPLNAEDERAFGAWAKAQRRGPGVDATRDLYDYDLRGYWKKNGGETLAEGAHLTDEFKKPNHPTFSDESKYHGIDGHEGGKWGGSEKEGWTFTPGKTNIQMQGQHGLQEYFDQYEPKSKLLGTDNPMPEINMAKPTSKLNTPAGLPVFPGMGIRG
jgi:hypothetical protein